MNSHGFNPFVFCVENFPKPYTKKEARMIKADETNTDETIMEEVVITDEDEEESKNTLPDLKT